MNEQERLFISSIRNKILFYYLPTTVIECLEKASGRFIETIYNDESVEIVDIGIERFLCLISPLYFISRYAWIPFPGKGEVPFSLYYFQKELLKEVIDLKKLVFLKTRQAGISTLASIYCLWKANFHASEAIDIVSTTQKKARNFTSKMDPTIKKLPSFLSTPTIVKNQQEIKWTNGSVMVSESASIRAGRGDSLSLLVLDEAAHYISDNLTRGIIAAAGPTLSKTGGDLMVISTPFGTSGAGSYFYEQVNQLQINGNTKKEKLVEIDWWEIPDEIDIDPKRSYNVTLQKAINEGYYYKPRIKKKYKDFFDPIAKDWRNNAWLKEQHDTLGDSLFKQEIEHNFIVSADQVFSEDILERAKESIKDPLYENTLGKTQIMGLWTWKLPIPKHRYIIGVDPSKGSSNDFSCIQVMDVENYEQVAEYKARISTKLLGRLVKVIARYYNQAYVVVEANGIGEAVFNEVYHHDVDPYDNVYKQKKTRDGKIIITGWDTTVKTRLLMTNSVIDWFSVDELWEELKVYSRRLWQELTTWVWKSGRADHTENAHDDAIIAFGLCLAMRNKAHSSGESFLLVEDGSLVEFESKDKNDDSLESTQAFDVAMTEEEGIEEKIKENYNCSLEEYRWMLS